MCMYVLHLCTADCTVLPEVLPLVYALVNICIAVDFCGGKIRLHQQCFILWIGPSASTARLHCTSGTVPASTPHAEQSRSSRPFFLLLPCGYCLPPSPLLRVGAVSSRSASSFFRSFAIHRYSLLPLLLLLLMLLPPFQSMVSEQPERFFVSEIIREQIFVQYDQEIPYSCQVQIADFQERKGAKDYIQVCGCD